MPNDFTAFDAYINSQGLLFHEAENAQSETVTIPLRPVRSDTGENPWETRTESGDIFSQGGWLSGMGQDKFHRPSSDPEAYLHSEGIGHTDEGTMLAIRPTGTTSVGAITGGGRFTIGATDGYVWVASGNNVHTTLTPSGVWSSASPHAADPATAVLDLTSKGSELFAALGTNGVHRRTTAPAWVHHQPDGATDLNINPAYRVAWVMDRLMVVGGTGYRSIYEVVASSTPTALETLPDGWTFEDIFENNGFIYACAVSTTTRSSRIHIYGLNSAATAIEKKGSIPMPTGVLIYCGLGYVGQAFLAGGVMNGSGGLDPCFYSATADAEGFLTYQLIADVDGAGATDLAVRSMSANENRIIMGWPQGTDYAYGARTGIATYDISRAAFFNTLASSIVAAENVLGVIYYRGQELFSTAAGVYYRNTANWGSTAGHLITSVADWNNASLKIWDKIELSHAALPTGASIQVQYTTVHPSENSWTTAVTNSTAGSLVTTATLTNVTSRLFALKIILTSHTTNGPPKVQNFSVRSYPYLATPEWNLSRYFRFIDRDRKSDRGQEIRQNPRTVRNTIMDLVGQGVTYYEADATWTARITQAAVIEPIEPLYQSSTGDPVDEAYVLQVVMQGTRA